jgi:hypothetical protein
MSQDPPIYLSMYIVFNILHHVYTYNSVNISIHVCILCIYIHIVLVNQAQ